MTLDWRDDLVVGSVVYEGGNHSRPRIVRKITRKGNGLVHSVTFSILHCSWTERPYTVLCRSDLATRGFTPAGCRVITSKRRLDKRLAATIANHEDRRMTCCDVVGICR